MIKPLMAPFSLARIPEIHFGPGVLGRLPSLLNGKARRVLLVTGTSSFVNSERFGVLQQSLGSAGIDSLHCMVAGEPSPGFVDQVSAQHRGSGIDWVVAIGGGSAIDAGKAISAMLLQERSVLCHLEGRETHAHDGRKIPFAAVPTSSGTGAEATKNAVLSEVGASGFKSSLRHDNFVPDMALVDPELMLTCPRPITAACGLDALTQLLESYVSTKASAITDALALSALEHVAAGFLPVINEGAGDLLARSRMAYAALISGITLANAGLGLVHGFAGPVGGFSHMPHGAVCGTLLGETTRVTLSALFEDPVTHRVALEKYARAGVLLSGRASASLEGDCRALVETLANWVKLAGMPRLGEFGIVSADLPKILEKANGKNSPVVLSVKQMTSILSARL